MKTLLRADGRLLLFRNTGVPRPVHARQILFGIEHHRPPWFSSSFTRGFTFSKSHFPNSSDRNESSQPEGADTAPPESEQTTKKTSRARQILSIPKVPKLTADDMLSLLDDVHAEPEDPSFLLGRDRKADKTTVEHPEVPSDFETPTYQDSIGQYPHLELIYEQLESLVEEYQRDMLRGFVGQVTLRDIYQTYRRLPDPYMAYIPARMRHELLRIFGIPERRDTPAMLHYFALMGDVYQAGYQLTLAEWNYAIAYAKRSVENVTQTWIDEALKKWKEMESTTAMRANEVTFNMLFDAAAKCGRYDLAKVLYDEMIKRGHSFNRFHRVTVLQLYGLRKDVDGIRAAYRELVEAGEVVDTTVLNCVISGFFNCMEETAAEYVFNRMKKHSKALVNRRPEHPPNYALRRVVTQVLMMLGRISYKHPSLQAANQSTSYVAPDVRTFRIFVQHYGVRMGNMPKLAQYLDEMHTLEIPLDGRIFISIFEAFANHASQGPEAEFTLDQLNSVFQALLRSLDEHIPGVEVDGWMFIWVVRAFDQCAPEQTVVSAFAELENRSELSAPRMQYLHGYLRRVLERRDRFQQQKLEMGGPNLGSQWTGLLGRQAQRKREQDDRGRWA